MECGDVTPLLFLCFSCFLLFFFCARCHAKQKNKSGVTSPHSIKRKNKSGVTSPHSIKTATSTSASEGKPRWRFGLRYDHFRTTGAQRNSCASAEHPTPAEVFSCFPSAASS